MLILYFIYFSEREVQFGRIGLVTGAAFSGSQAFFAPRIKPWIIATPYQTQFLIAASMYIIACSAGIGAAFRSIYATSTGAFSSKDFEVVLNEGAPQSYFGQSRKDS